MKQILVFVFIAAYTAGFGHPLSSDSFLIKKPARPISCNTYIASPEIALGGAMGKQLKHVYGFGMRFGGYLGFPVPKTGLNLGPQFYYSIFGNYLSSSAECRNNSYNAGIRANYFFLVTMKRKFIVFPVTGVSFTWGIDKILPRHVAATPLTTYTFMGYAINLGAGFDIKGFSVQVIYEVNRVKATLSQHFYNEATSYAAGFYPTLYPLYNVPRTTNMNFDKLMVTVTYNLRFKKMK